MSTGRTAVKQVVLVSFLLAVGAPFAGSASILYDSAPNPLPPNLPSLGYEATETAELGDLIQFAGTSRSLSRVTLVMSDWAQAADSPSFPGASGPTWSHPL